MSKSEGQDTPNINSTQQAMTVSKISIIVNLSLSVFKFLAGIIAQSGAMISDAIHSASDVFSTFIVMIGVTMAGKKSDKEHPYGHERLECVASIILSVLLAITGIGIGISGIEKILAGDYENLQVPGTLALAAAIISVLVKEWMFWYTKRVATRIKSGALMADAWHHRSDSMSSIGAFIGILGARMGFPIMDSVASVIICLFIVKASFEIFQDAMDKMVDKACPDDVINEMTNVILANEEVRAIDDLKTRLFGAKIYVEVEIAVDANMPLFIAHTIAEAVHDNIEANFPDVKHCTVHVNPWKSKDNRPEKEAWMLH